MEKDKETEWMKNVEIFLFDKNQQSAEEIPFVAQMNALEKNVKLLLIWKLVIEKDVLENTQACIVDFLHMNVGELAKLVSLGEQRHPLTIQQSIKKSTESLEQQCHLNTAIQYLLMSQEGVKDLSIISGISEKFTYHSWLETRGEAGERVIIETTPVVRKRYYGFQQTTCSFIAEEAAGILELIGDHRTGKRSEYSEERIDLLEKILLSLRWAN